MNNARKKTLAIVLRRTDFGEADRIINLLTPSGKVSAMARGVRKPKSKLAGGIEFFALNEVVLIEGKSEMRTLSSARMREFFGEILKANPEKLNHYNLQELLEFIDDLLGLNLLGSTPDIPEEIKKKIIERNATRAEKDWAKSDEIRDELLSKNIVLRDTPKKSFWEYK